MLTVLLETSFADEDGGFDAFYERVIQIPLGLEEALIYWAQLGAENGWPRVDPKLCPNVGYWFDSAQLNGQFYDFSWIG